VTAKKTSQFEPSHLQDLLECALLVPEQLWGQLLEDEGDVVQDHRVLGGQFYITSCQSTQISPWRRSIFVVYIRKDNR